MKHDLEVRVTGRPQTERIVRCRIVSLREKLLTRLFGRREQMMILIPDPSVESVSIAEAAEGGVAHEYSTIPTASADGTAVSCPWHSSTRHLPVMD